MHYWEALLALWSEKTFTNCLLPRSAAKDSSIVEGSGICDSELGWGSG